MPSLASLRHARWIIAPKEFAAPVILRRFTARAGDTGRISLSALGFFRVYLNGQLVADDYFLPAGSLPCPRPPEAFTLYPIRDSFTYRAYVTQYELTPYLIEGENQLEIALGDGWYRQTERFIEGRMEFGEALGCIFGLEIGDTHLYSDGRESCRDSATVYAQLFIGEVYDARIARDARYRTAPVEIIELPDTALTLAEAPPDRIIRTLTPRLIHTEGERKLYDAGENISGFVTLRTAAPEGARITLRFAEEITPDGQLDHRSAGAQYDCRSGRKQVMEDVFIGDGTPHLWHPSFVWHAFRYVEVIGDGSPEEVCVVHADTPRSGAFISSSPELNWLYDAYVRTQLANMHGGFPSDCPHRERLGYTGDGQICAAAAMTMLEAKGFYRTWIRDIFDSQDRLSGHVNHTAPFAGGGGGPGGWGCAAVTVPWNYYRYYGDAEPLQSYYPSMKQWIAYLTERMEEGLLVREEEGGWCLGDWLTLEPIQLPEPYVNTCYLIRTLSLMESIARVSGHPDDIAQYASLRCTAEDAVRRTYRDESSGSFVGGVQGADAYALWCGIGDDRTAACLTEKYRALGHYDTGFLGTDILTEVLFTLGEADLAYTLLTAHGQGSFAYMQAHGATTLWESWSGGGSHAHPMFGAASRQLFSAILGITQRPESAGYHALVIAPKIPTRLTYASGYQTIPSGRVEVACRRRGEEIQLCLSLPAPAEFCWRTETLRLHAGEWKITIDTNGGIQYDGRSDQGIPEHAPAVRV